MCSKRTVCVSIQVGKYKPAQRAATVAYRGAHFFGVASMFGHSLTKYMVDESCSSTHAKARGEEADNKLAPLLDNSIAWGGFVASRRRQLVNGSEERALIRDCPLLTLHTNVKNNWHSGWDFLPVN
ncbi:hypothetical protein WJX82_001088 [Trebouxia sp. C0006]